VERGRSFCRGRQPGLARPVPKSIGDRRASVCNWADVRGAVEAGHRSSTCTARTATSCTDSSRRSLIYVTTSTGDAVQRLRSPSRSARWCERRFPIVVLVHRLSVADGVLGGLTVDDSLTFVPALSARGVGVIDTSPEGIGSHRLIGARLPQACAFHAPLSAGLRSDTGLRLGTVGLIVPLRQTETIRRCGAADLVAQGRQALTDSHWPHHARPVVDIEPCNRWHAETGQFLRLRAAAPTRSTAPGEGPTSGYLAEERRRGCEA
jgi:hypothetical protein